MTNRAFAVLALICAFSAVVLAADISGKWVAQVPGRDGTPREQTLNFKQSGDTLTGTVSGRQSDTPIADGKVSGDTVSFTVTRQMGGNTVKWSYTGQISGNEIKFKRSGGRGEPIEFTAKRAQ